MRFCFAPSSFAVVEKHGRVERVEGQQLRHRSGRVRLGDPEPKRQRLLEREVIRLRVVSREQRRDHDAAMLDGVAELDVVLDHMDSSSQRSPQIRRRLLREFA